MRKYLLPSALILLVGLALSNAQIINKAIQLTQDTTGAFSVDTNFNVYFPGHILTVGPSAPAVSSCGTNPSVTGTDTAGTLSTGTAAASCTVTFNKAYISTPYCLITPQSNATTIGVAYTMSPTAFVVTYASGGGVLLNYICSGSK